jgi:hypothetical protein
LSKPIPRRDPATHRMAGVPRRFGFSHVINEIEAFPCRATPET